MMNNYVFQSDILGKLHDGDLVKIEYFNDKGVRVTQLFEVSIWKDNLIYVIENAHMQFNIIGLEFCETQCEPIIKAIIRKNDLDLIEHKVGPLKTTQSHSFSKSSSWVDEFIKKEKIRQEQTDIILSSTQYIEWLDDFTSRNDNVFYDTDWLYDPDIISDVDRENVEKLCLFVEAVDKYCQDNNIESTKSKFGHFHRVRLNDVGFEIGAELGQGVVFFCRKVAIDQEDDFIDVNNILVKNKQKVLSR